jgi:hypothetical protein
MAHKTVIRIALILLAAFFVVASLPADSGGTKTALTESQAYWKAEEALLLDFQNVFMKSKIFIDSYGDMSWDEYGEEVKDSVDIVRDRKAENAVKDGKNFFFIGTIFDIYVQLEIDRITGELRKIEYTF